MKIFQYKKYNTITQFLKFCFFRKLSNFYKKNRKLSTRNFHSHKRFEVIYRSKSNLRKLQPVEMKPYKIKKNKPTKYLFGKFGKKSQIVFTNKAANFYFDIAKNFVFYSKPKIYNYNKIKKKNSLFSGTLNWSLFSTHPISENTKLSLTDFFSVNYYLHNMDFFFPSNYEDNPNRKAEFLRSFVEKERYRVLNLFVSTKLPVKRKIFFSQTVFRKDPFLKIQFKKMRRKKRKKLHRRLRLKKTKKLAKRYGILLKTEIRFKKFLKKRLRLKKKISKFSRKFSLKTDYFFKLKLKWNVPKRKDRKKMKKRIRTLIWAKKKKKNKTKTKLKRLLILNFKIPKNLNTIIEKTKKKGIEPLS